MDKRNVGILVFDDVEVLDFAGPYEVFSRTRLAPGVESRRSLDLAPFHVFTVARTTDPIHATGGLRVIPDHSFATAPRIDILVVSGGFGTRPLLQNTEILDWIQSVAARASTTTSVCTGSLLLAKAGLLHGRRATTHWGALDLLGSLDETIRVERELRFVDDAIVTSAGIAAGIEMCFHVVESLCGREVAEDTARYMEYPRSGSQLR
jgi:transcriptional regulator GlxA family with amidase domain